MKQSTYAFDSITTESESLYCIYYVLLFKNPATSEN